VFFRIGRGAPGRATTSLLVNSSQVILDDIWAWRADHGNGVGWTDNVGDTGVVVNGDQVTAYGLFVEHYEKYEVIWSVTFRALWRRFRGVRWRGADEVSRSVGRERDASVGIQAMTVGTGYRPAAS
jgi:hypothetical protein